MKIVRGVYRRRGRRYAGTKLVDCKTHEAAPYAQPKLRAVAVTSMNGSDLEAMLERGAARPEVTQIELRAEEPSDGR